MCIYKFDLYIMQLTVKHACILNLNWKEKRYCLKQSQNDLLCVEGDDKLQSLKVTWTIKVQSTTLSLQFVWVTA